MVNSISEHPKIATDILKKLTGSKTVSPKENALFWSAFKIRGILTEHGLLKLGRRQ